MALDATAEDTHCHQHREIRSIYVKPKGVVFTQLLQTGSPLCIIWLFWYIALQSRVFIGVTRPRQGKSLGKPQCLCGKPYKAGKCSFLLKYLAKVNT